MGQVDWHIPELICDAVSRPQLTCTSVASFLHCYITTSHTPFNQAMMFSGTPTTASKFKSGSGQGGNTGVGSPLRVMQWGEGWSGIRSKLGFEMLDTDDDENIVSPCIVTRWRRRSCLRVNPRPQVLHAKHFDCSLLCVAMWVLRLCLRAEASKRNEPIIKSWHSDSQNRQCGHLNGLTGPCALRASPGTTWTAAERATVDSCTATALAGLGAGIDCVKSESAEE